MPEFVNFISSFRFMDFLSPKPTKKDLRLAGEPSALILSDGGGLSTPHAINHLERRLKSPKKVVKLNFRPPDGLDEYRLKGEVFAYMPWVAQQAENGDGGSRARIYLEGVLSGQLHAPETMKVIQIVQKVVSKLDAIFLPGGEHIPAHWYGGEDYGGYSDYRALLEFCFIKEARKRGIPLMGACRGFQATWVYHGASIISGVEGHRGGVDQEYPIVSSEQAGAVAAIFKEKVVGRNYHTQGVKAPSKASDLEVVAQYGGILKAAESKYSGASPIVLTQFHPEFYSETGFNGGLTRNNLDFFKILHQAGKIRRLKRKGITPEALQVAKTNLKALKV